MAKTLRNLEALTRAADEVMTNYSDGLRYHKSVGFQRDWPEFERFKSGDQWPAATEKTKALPRPVFNIIDLIESLKVSTVMSEQIMMRFSSMDSIEEESVEAADLFSRITDKVWEQVKQNDLNEEMLDICSNIGTGILHYYWDNDYVAGNKRPVVGRMCGEVLDPINVFFSNPQQKNVQKQPYIVISYREMVSIVREEAEREGLSKNLVKLIVADNKKTDEGYDAAMTEVNSSDKTTVLLKYYKRGKKVYFKKVASGIETKGETDTGMKLYPIAIMQWKRRRKSIHGVGDTQGLIPNQRAINFLIAMSILSAQLTGWPKLAIDPERVDKSKITNSPGEIVEVKNANQGIDTALKFLNPGSISPQVNGLVSSIIDLTRQMTSANDVATGQAPGANMSAAAINLLQRQNGVPIEGVKRRFYQCMEDVGRIWEEFMKVKYNLPRDILIKDAQGDDESVEFLGTDYKDMDMDLKIDVGPSSMYSEALMMTSLDKFLDAQFISFEQYLRYAPPNVVPFRERLLRELEQLTQQSQAAPVDPLAALTPEQRAQFEALPPEIQQQIMQQAQGGI